MKILMVNKFHYLRGGTERYCFDMAELLRRKGHAVIPFAMAHEANLVSEYAPYFVEEISLERSADLRRPLRSLQAAARAVYSHQARRNLGSLIDQERPDIAYLHNIHHQISLSILPLLKECGVPIVWRLHDYALVCPNSLFYTHDAPCEACAGGRYFQIVLRRCRRDSRAASLVACLASYLERWLGFAGLVDRFISPSRFLKTKMAEHGLDGEKIIVQPNFVDLDDVAPPPRQAREGGDYLLYVGRLSGEKGVRTLIQAVARVPASRLQVVGDGPQRRELETLAGQVAPGRICFTGYQQAGALFDRVWDAQAVVVPSEWYENCPYAILEAFAAGKPVIASDIGGIPELITDGQQGLLFEPGNVLQLATQIDRLARDPREASALGNQARHKVEQYGADAHYQRFMDICAPLVHAPAR